MSLKEKLSYFWNVTLGEDYPEAEDIEKSNNPEFAELKESLNRVQDIENKFSNSTVSKKPVKENKNKIVKTVVIDQKAAAKTAETKKETKSVEEKEINAR